MRVVKRTLLLDSNTKKESALITLLIERSIFCFVSPLSSCGIELFSNNTLPLSFSDRFFLLVLLYAVLCCVEYDLTCINIISALFKSSYFLLEVFFSCHGRCSEKGRNTMNAESML